MTPPMNLPSGYDPQKDKIEIVDYDPSWPLLFTEEENRLQKTLKAFSGLKIEHFGSTSIPGLAAKPILDIMLSVESVALWPGLVKPLQAIGYIYWRENPEENEMFFVKGMPPYGEKRSHHLHVYDFEGSRWKKELGFRDYLKNHPEEAKRYGELKRQLAIRFATNREAYTDAKTDYIRGVLEKIGR